MEQMNTRQPYLIGENVKSTDDFPFLLLDMKDDSCIPARDVFQVLHRHEEVEFLLVLENKLHIQTSMREVVLEAGEGAFIPKNVLHILNTYSTCKCKCLVFSEALLVPSTNMEIQNELTKYTANPLVDLVVIGRNGKGKDVINQLHKLNQIEFTHRYDPYYKYKMLASLYDVWHSFIQFIDKELPEEPLVKVEKSEQLRCYLEYIHFHYAKDISIKDIASSAYTSVSECNRIFRRNLNVTAYEYLIRYRMNKSLELIKSRKCSLAQIALEVGYESASHFSQAFRKYNGMSPSAYRKMW